MACLYHQVKYIMPLSIIKYLSDNRCESVISHYGNESAALFSNLLSMLIDCCALS